VWPRSRFRSGLESSAPGRVLKEIIDARVWGGIHFRTADMQGKKLAHWELKHYFQPVG
jgi:hypothetical protein